MSKKFSELMFVIFIDKKKRVLVRYLFCLIALQHILFGPGSARLTRHQHDIFLIAIIFLLLGGIYISFSINSNLMHLDVRTFELEFDYTNEEAGPNPISETPITASPNLSICAEPMTFCPLTFQLFPSYSKT